MMRTRLARRPVSDRSITGGALPDLAAPAIVEERASVLLEERRAEFFGTGWAQVFEQHQHDRAMLRTEIAYRGLAASAAAQRDALAAELAARDATLTWRVRPRVLRLPGVAAWRRRG
jgi:hypothetical protein